MYFHILFTIHKLPTLQFFCSVCSLFSTYVVNNQNAVVSWISTTIMYKMFQALMLNVISVLVIQLLKYFQLDGDCSRQLTGSAVTDEENSIAVNLINTICQR